MERLIVNLDWVFYVFLLGLMFLAVAKYFNPVKFVEILVVFFSKKFFISAQHEDNFLFNRFNVLLFINQLLVFTAVLYLFFSSWFIDSTRWLDWFYLKMMAVITGFIFFKFIMDILIGWVFQMRFSMMQFNFVKLTFRNVIGIVFLPILLILMNLYPLNFTQIVWLAGLYVVLNLLAFVRAFVSFRKWLGPYLFYFILYLCTLEIAPYIILYKLLLD